MTRTRALALSAALVACAAPVTGCAPEGPDPGHYGGDVTAADGTLAYRSQLMALTATPGGMDDYAALEDLTVELCDGAIDRLEVMVENLDSEPVADAIVAAASRGVDVRIVGDVDRRTQRGFARLEAAGLAPVYGDGEILWNGVFGEDPILRTGEDNRLTHNVFIADRRRIVSLSAGFPQDGPDIAQAGFVALGEVFGRDFGNVFDQLYGGVFATTLTYYDQGVPSDTNNRTAYPIEDGVVELYFGPQEPIIKELIDRIYGARAAVWVATPELRNAELVRALRYKIQSGFDVRIIVGDREASRDEGGEIDAALEALAERPDAGDIFRVNPTIGGTLIVLDGQPTFTGDVHQPGLALVSTSPIFASVPYYIAEVRQDGLDLAALPSDRFTDGHLWGVREGTDRDSPDYAVLRAQFEAIYAASEE